MELSKAAKTLYYSKADNENTLNSISAIIETEIAYCRPELLCVLKDITETEPSCYWNRDIANITKQQLSEIADLNPELEINESIFVFFLTGYNTYRQITEVINDLSKIKINPIIKNRMYRIPTYISIVEGCLTNFYRFISLLLNQTTEKDYASTFKLKSLCDILQKNGFDKLIEKVDIDVRNAINHGGVIFKDGGQKICLSFISGGKNIVIDKSEYDFDQLIDDVYDTASGILLGLTLFLNNNWHKINIDISKRSFASFGVLSMAMSIPQIRCIYISEAPYYNQLNAEFWVVDTDRNSIIQTACLIVLMIYEQYRDYERYYIGFSNERMPGSWVRFKGSDIQDVIKGTRTFSEILKSMNSKGEIIIFPASTAQVDLQEIKYFQFPDYQSDFYQIRCVEDVSLEDRKRLKCQMYIGDVVEKDMIVKIIKSGIEWLKTLKNVDSPTMHVKNGSMEADSLYIKVYRNDGRQNKSLLPNNTNFVCLVDYNKTGVTTLKNGGLPSKIWEQYYHEKIGLFDIAWREQPAF